MLGVSVVVVVPAWQPGALHLKSVVSLLKPGVLLFAKNDAGSEAVARYTRPEDH